MILNTSVRITFEYCHCIAYLSFQIEDFEPFLTHFLLLLSIFFPKLKKLNISAIYKASILIFSVNLPMVWYVSTMIHPPGEPREHHLGEVL